MLPDKPLKQLIDRFWSTMKRWNVGYAHTLCVGLHRICRNTHFSPLFFSSAFNLYEISIFVVDKSFI